MKTKIYYYILGIIGISIVLVSLALIFRAQAAQENATIYIYKGWNLISSPFEESLSLSKIAQQCDLTTYKGKIWAWTYDPENGWTQPTQVRKDEGVYILSKENCTVNLTGTPATFSSKTLKRGWNLISAEKSFEEIKGDCQIPSGYKIWALNPQTQQWINPATTDKLDQRNGYWVAVGSNCSLSKPIVQKCADGTLYGQCSINKPKYCDNGNLVDKASLCGCPTGYKISNEECEKIVPPTTYENTDALIKDVFGGKVNFIVSEDPNLFLENDIGQHAFDTSWTNCQPMIEKVNELIEGKSTYYEKAKSIINWLANSRQYSEPSPLSAEGKDMCEAFGVNYGICHDAAYLGVAMLRLADIPSRIVGPVVDARHNYLEFYSDGKWWGIDGTFCKPCGGERFALERSAILGIFQSIKFSLPKELISLEGWRGYYTGRTFHYSVNSIILNAPSKKDLLLDFGSYQTEKIEWGKLTYINPFYEISNSRITGVKAVIDNLDCNMYDCGKLQGNTETIYLPSGANILVAGNRITYENGKKTGEISNITADQPFIFEDFYATTTLPPSQYRFWYGDIAFVDIKINPGDKAEINPDTLIKANNITQKEFDDFIAYLKTVK